MNLTEREIEFLRYLCEKQMGIIARSPLRAGDGALLSGMERSMARDLYFKLAEIPVR